MSEDQGSGNETVNAQFGELVDNGNLETAFAEKEAEEIKDSEEKEESKEEADFSKKFAALSRKEKDLRSRESSYEQRMAELQAKLDEIEAQKQQEPEVEPELPLEYRLRKDPLGTLSEMGLDYDALTELALNDGKLSQDMQMKLMREEIEKGYQDKYSKLEERLNLKEKEEEEAQYNKVIDNFKSEIQDHVGGDSEAYELIQANEAQDLVYDVIEEHYKEEGKVLSIEEASEAVESYLEEEARKLLSLKKLSPKQEAELEAKEPSAPRQSPVTLSNDHSAASQNQADRKLSNEESAAQAAKLLKWS